MLIESSKPHAAAGQPLQETIGEVQTSPDAVASEPLFDQAGGVVNDQRSVGPVPQTLEQPTITQVLFRQHDLVLRC
ncbi:hypothetical protein CCR96_21790 [Halochromatium roseum]|nr:hypothetical protein [Halochromatium roseum]